MICTPLNEKEYQMLVAEICQTTAPSRLLCSALHNCHDCGAKPGRPHRAGCDTERCSVCGEQRIQCRCKGHDRAFARWTGFWPGLAESAALGIDLNEFHLRGLHRVFFVKPNNACSVTLQGGQRV